MNLPNFSAKKKGEGIMNQTLRDLTAARDLLVKDGWCQQWLYDRSTGQHCAVGAVLRVTGMASPWRRWHFDRDAAYLDARVNAALDALYEHLPASAKRCEWWHGVSVHVKWGQIAKYNNGNFEGTILDLFNNTIAALTEVAAPEGEELVSV
jgi:hypothetical protein